MQWIEASGDPMIIQLVSINKVLLEKGASFYYGFNRINKNLL